MTAAARVAVALTVNGSPVEAAVEPRTHLADLLREELGLTGTHLGCEHGVCGACTVEIDGSPQRGCIAFAAACDGADVRTIEGLDEDPLAAALREAFAAEHALQCGYCTPGMLIAARDIVLRLPDADESAVREALAGNLCRCTGYRGIVRAVLRVLAEQRGSLHVAAPAAAPPGGTGAGLGTLAAREERARAAPGSPASESPAAPRADPRPALGAPAVRQVVDVAAPAARVWEALRDPVLVAGCVPGVELTEALPDGTVRGAFRVRLGPMGARFAGEGRVTYDDAARTARISGKGADTGGPSRVSGEARLRLLEAAPGRARLEIEAEHRLTGLLAQFSRGAVAQAVAARLAGEFARALERRLLSGVDADAPAEPVAGRSAWRALAAWLRRRLGGGGRA